MRAPVKDEALSCVSRQADHSTETPKPEKEDEEVSDYHYGCYDVIQVGMISSFLLIPTYVVLHRQKF